MRFKITHITDYDYNTDISFCHNIANIKPRSFVGQTLEDFKLEITPSPTNTFDRVDFNGNYLNYFSILKPHSSLQVKSTAIIDRNIFFNELDYTNKITLENALIELDSNAPLYTDALAFTLNSNFLKKGNSLIKEYAQHSFKANRPVYESAKELMQRIYIDFKFDPNFSTISTPLNDLMKEKKGVCQDFAHIGIACLREMGLPARYISGYIETLPPPGKTKLIGVDASHAWFSVFIPTIGWVDFDPTNNQIPKNQHITTSWGRDYFDVPPIKGVLYGYGKSKLNVSVDIARI